MYAFRKTFTTKDVSRYKIISLDNSLPMPISHIMQSITLIGDVLYDAFNTIKNNPDIEYKISTWELSETKPDCPFIELEIPSSHFWWDQYKEVGLKLYDINSLKFKRISLPYYSEDQENWICPILEDSNTQKISEMFKEWHNENALVIRQHDDSPVLFPVPVIDKNTKDLLIGENSIGLAIMRGETTIPCVEIDLTAEPLFVQTFDYLDGDRLKHLGELGDGLNKVSSLNLTIFRRGNKIYPCDEDTRKYFLRFGLKKISPRYTEYKVKVANKDQLYSFLEAYTVAMFKTYGLITTPRSLFKPLIQSDDKFASIWVSHTGFAHITEVEREYDEMLICISNTINVQLNKWFEVISERTL